MPRKRESPAVSNEDVALLGIDYVNKKDAIKNLESQCKKERVALEDFLKVNGKTLPTGSVMAVVPHADVEVVMKHTLRVSKVLLPEAIDVLKAEGLERCIEQVPVIREDVLENLYSLGKVSDDVLKKLYGNKQTFAFSVELKPKGTILDEEA